MYTLNLLHMYPAMLDLYGDSGNVEILKYRCSMRNITLNVIKHDYGESCPDFSSFDIIYLGGGADFEQQLLADELINFKNNLVKAYNDKVFFLMICGGYQLMGKYYKDSNGKEIPGVGLFNYCTIASTDKRKRCIGNIIIKTTINGNEYKVIGFENHGGQTENVKSPFGKVIYGNGNKFNDEYEGFQEENVIATYLHGPLLSKNPKLSDYIISYCMNRATGNEYTLNAINDKLEDKCRSLLINRFLNKQ